MIAENRSLSRRQRQRRKSGSTSENFDNVRADYEATKSSRFVRQRRGLAPQGSGADYHYRNEFDYLRLMELARDMDRNDAIVGQAIDRAVSNTIQDGFTVDPDTGDAGADQAIKDRWKNWAEDPDQVDVAGENNFWDLENNALRSSFVDGDSFAIPLRNGTLEVLEGHRCRTPVGRKGGFKTAEGVVHGVKMDRYRRRHEYWFTKEDIDPNRQVQRLKDIRRIAARDSEGYKQVFQMMFGKRYSQTRGVTALAPIFMPAGWFEDINFAKMVQAQVVSCIGFIRKRELNFDDMGEDGPAPIGERKTQTLSDGSSRTVDGLAPGIEIEGEPGEEIEAFSPSVPNPEFFDHVHLILTLLGINLGLPLAMLTLDSGETNFSGWRGAVDQARMGFRRNQKRLANRFHKPIYCWKLRQWADEDSSLAKLMDKEGSLFRHKWNAPSWNYIEPFKDAMADVVQQKNTLNSPRRIQMARGRDYSEIIRETIEDNSMAIRSAIAEANAINKELKPNPPIHWRELLSPPMPDGMTLSLGSMVGESEQSRAGAPSNRNPREAEQQYA